MHGLSQAVLKKSHSSIIESILDRSRGDACSQHAPQSMSHTFTNLLQSMDSASYLSPSASQILNPLTPRD